MKRGPAEQTKRICRAYVCGGLTREAIAHEFGVPVSTVHKALCNPAGKRECQRLRKRIEDKAVELAAKRLLSDT